ncbi:MAG: hypothetical protein ACI4EN_08240 [Butyrivibrio sp.]
MKRVKLCLIILVCVFFLPGCNKTYYLEREYINSIYEKAVMYNTDALSAQGYDNEQSSCWFDYSTSNGRQIYYVYPGSSLILDIKNMTYRNPCNVVGCNHTGAACENSFVKYCPRWHSDGLYFMNGSSLYYKNNDGEITKVFTNTFSTEWTQKMDPNEPGLLCGMIFLDEHTLLLAGRNYYLQYDLITNEVSEPVIAPDGIIFGFCYFDGIIFSSYDNGKLVRTDWDTGESKIISQQGYYVRKIGDRIWYARTADKMGVICSNNVDFTDEKIEINDAYVMFNVFDDVIIYSDSRNQCFYLKDSENNIRQLFSLEDLTYSFEKLPEKYHYNEDKSDPKPETVNFLHYENDNVYFAAGYPVRRKNASEYWYVFYEIDSEGNITEFTGETE